MRFSVFTIHFMDHRYCSAKGPQNSPNENRKIVPVYQACRLQKVNKYNSKYTTDNEFNQLVFC